MMDNLNKVLISTGDIESARKAPSYMYTVPTCKLLSATRLRNTKLCD